MTSSGDRIDNVEPTANLPQPYRELKLEVEHLHQVVNRLQSLALLLAGGLTFGFFVSLAISGWFAYSLEVEKREAKRTTRVFAVERQEFIERVDALQTRIDALEAGTERDLATFRTQQQRDRRLITQLRGRLDALTDPNNPAPVSEDPPPS
ncbi:MAG: hypothetical protein AAFY11_04920, partial [Cyanobacteria bacterium J06641_5]